jgi:hypothetical protein
MIAMDKPNRLLSNEDIAEMEKLTVDRVIEAIDGYQGAWDAFRGD